ncbi:MAG TPA: ABC transporter substrate-binding protein [Acidimicrobiales bacterium]
MGASVHRRAALCVVAALVLTLAACTDSKKPAGAGSSSSRGPTVGGTLRIGIDRPASLDPATASPASQGELLMADLLFDGLTRIGDGDVTASPSIAESWTASPDQRTWTFKLRADAHFSNGRAITAADAKYSLERVAKQGQASVAALRLELISGLAPYLSGAAADIAGLKAIDDHTLEIDLDGPLSVLPELLAAPEFGVVPKEAVEAAAPAFGTAPVGSGPFAFTGQQGDVVSLVRATNGSAYLDAIEVHEYDKANLGQSFEDFAAAKLDWSLVSNDRAEEAAQRFGPSQFRPFDAELFYAFNLLDPTFADVRFRQAIVKSVDRDALVKAVYPALADPLGGIVPAGVAGHVEDPCGTPCAFDPAGAKALLAQAFPDGNIPTVNLDYFTGTGEDAVAGAIESGLAAVGVPTNKRPLPPDQYDQFAVSGQQGLFRLGAIGVYPSPDAYLAPLFTSGSRDNATGFSNPAVDQLLAAARANPDPATRVQQYQQAEAAIMQQVPILPIAQFLTKSVASPRVHDLTITVNGTFAGDKVWLG